MIAIIDKLTGALTVEGVDESLFAGLLPAADEVNCGRPLAHVTLPASTGSELRVHAIWHGDVTSGPGRRSVIQVQGCPIRCLSCYVPQTHDAGAGTAFAVGDILPVLLADRHRDGITILGGEPFAQPFGLWRLLDSLEGEHVVVYSGFYLEAIVRRLGGPLARELFGMIDVLVDGPYIAAKAAGAGEWKGSTNQRIITNPLEVAL